MRIRADIIRLHSLYHEKNIATRELVLIYYWENDRNILSYCSHASLTLRCQAMRHSADHKVITTPAS